MIQFFYLDNTKQKPFSNYQIMQISKSDTEYIWRLRSIGSIV